MDPLSNRMDGLKISAMTVAALCASQTRSLSLPTASRSATIAFEGGFGDGNAGPVKF
jgi:hypothetical protein